jgi:hypothetical protein
MVKPNEKGKARIVTGAGGAPTMAALIVHKVISR